MKISASSAIKLTTIMTDEDRQALSQSIEILDTILHTLIREECDTIALCHGDELRDDNLQDAIETLEAVLNNLPQETQIWGY